MFSREIRLTNRGSRPCRSPGCPASSWELPGGDYTLRYLWGSWGQERQLATETLAAGARRFEQTRGRSTNGYVPWLSLRNRTLGVEYIAELAWSGNWWMEVERQPGTGAAPLRDQPVRVGLGMHNDFGGPLTLAPGDTITLPRAVFTATAGDLDDAANQMHRYQRSYLVPRVRTNQPPLVQFNTWFPLGPGGRYHQHDPGRGCGSRDRRRGVRAGLRVVRQRRLGADPGRLRARSPQVPARASRSWPITFTTRA